MTTGVLNLQFNIWCFVNLSEKWESNIFKEKLQCRYGSKVYSRLQYFITLQLEIMQFYSNLLHNFLDIASKAFYVWQRRLSYETNNSGDDLKIRVN